MKFVFERTNKADAADDDDMALMAIIESLVAIINRPGVDLPDWALQVMARSEWHSRSMGSAQQVLAAMDVLDWFSSQWGRC